MKYKYLASIFLILIVIALVAVSCGGKDTPYKNPESFILDPETGDYYVSNVNGTPIQADENGYITKLDKDLKVTKQYFVDSASGGVELSAPKGMVIVGDILYVTDITSLKEYDKNTGENLADIDLKDKNAKFLNDVCADEDGNVYISDMSSNIIYRLDSADNQVTVYYEGEDVIKPNGLIIDPATGDLIAVTWEGWIKTISQDGEVDKYIDEKLNALDGADFDAAGNLYVSNYQEGKIYKITPDKKVSVIKEELKDPADISVDRKNNRLLVSEMAADRITTIDLE